MFAMAVSCVPSIGLPASGAQRWLPTPESIFELWRSQWHEAPRSERRREARRIVSTPLDLIPLCDENFTPVCETLRVECRDVSKSGFRIRHGQPLAWRTVGLVFPFDVDQTIWVTRLKWCRFTRDGLYESGGMVLRALCGTDSQAVEL
jgi:hypothetical protein